MKKVMELSIKSAKKVTGGTSCTCSSSCDPDDMKLASKAGPQLGL